VFGMMQLKGPFAKPNPRRGIILAVKFLLAAAVVCFILFLAISNQRCYKLLHGLSRIECHPSNLSEQALKVIVEQTLQGAFADRCERPLHDCALYVEAVVKKSAEQCTSKMLPNQASVRFEIQEKAYCDGRNVGIINSEKLEQ
jgi:hypothetical protein